MEICMLWDTFGQPTAARRGIARIRHLDGTKGDPAGQTTALFINSNCRYAFRFNGSEADIRISKPDVGIQKNSAYDLRPLCTSRILTAYTVKGSARRKLLQKLIFPSPRLSKKNAFRKSLKTGTRKSLFSPIPDPLVSAMPERKPPTAFYGILLPLMPKKLSVCSKFLFFKNTPLWQNFGF
ncbi:hypothetical protein AVEN_84957-1 [Araneus ventricosus]|uniref:Uncharacterized protein n=1 Tax=Araneus ventricosus TaxID=182803 RepID=A0A4Y2C0X7_ARAVE|nr:hypothetical protein AVEN_84957-1 [Araneus ventricosus]